MCKECETKPVYEFTNQRKLCKNCFIRWFQKKFLYSIRKFNMIQKGDVIAYQNNQTFRDIVLEDNLKMFSERSGIQIIKLPTKKKFNKKAISSTCDLNSDKFIHILIGKDIKKIKELLPSQEKEISPLYLFLDKEILLYTKLRELKFKEVKWEKDNFGKLIDDLEIKHPEIKQAIMQGYLQLFN